MDSREVLWATLAKVTERKAKQMVRSRWRYVSIDNSATGSECEPNGLGRVAVVEPTPEYQALVKLTLAQLVDKLENPLWRQAVLLRLDGYSVAEIAQRLGKGRGVVYVWFRAIEEIWEEHLEGQTFLD